MIHLCSANSTTFWYFVMTTLANDYAYVFSRSPPITTHLSSCPFICTASPKEREKVFEENWVSPPFSSHSWILESHLILHLWSLISKEVFIRSFQNNHKWLILPKGQMVRKIINLGNFLPKRFEVSEGCCSWKSYYSSWRGGEKRKNLPLNVSSVYIWYQAMKLDSDCLFGTHIKIATLFLSSWFGPYI